VEPRVQSAHIAPDEWLGERTADAAADDLRDVRVIETHHRDAAALRDLPGAPRRMERIARLDERRLERIENPRPAARIERQAVVEAGRYGVARERAQSAALELIIPPGDDDRVLPGGVGGEPRVLGREIALDATAGGRIKQRGINKMHGFFCRPSVPRPDAGALHLHDGERVKRGRPRGEGRGQGSGGRALAFGGTRLIAPPWCCSHIVSPSEGALSVAPTMTSTSAGVMP